MPLMVEIETNPAFKPTDAAAKEAWEAARKAGRVSVAYMTAMENVRNSGGLYRLAAKAAEKSPVSERDLEDMSVAELKAMATSLGIRSDKPLKKAELVALVREKSVGLEVTEE